jgi:AcrR family transcriptional regulator
VALSDPAELMRDPSALPVRARGTHTRAGNAMARTRAAVLEGAVRAVAKHGARRTTMADIASLSGVARATLYNHFRTRDAVYAAVCEQEIGELAAEGEAAPDLAEALRTAAERLVENPAVRRIAAAGLDGPEPAALAELTRIGAGPGWTLARESAAAVLAAHGAPADADAAETVLRWIVSHVCAPAAGATMSRGAAVLAAGLAAEPAEVRADQPA